MATIKSSSFPLAMLVILAMAHNHMTRAQNTCASSLTSLNVCAPFVVPGASSSPTPDCCGALQGVDHDCLCSTLRIASRIPAQCNLPPLTCAN